MLSLGAMIYVLCMLASAACAWLLMRSYVRNWTRLLLWSSICFIFLALNNLLLVIDLVVLPTTVDLSIPRQLTALLAVTILLAGFIWELD
jgi:hypothetical protein